MFRIKPLQCLRDTPQKEVFNEMLFDIPKFYNLPVCSLMCCSFYKALYPILLCQLCYTATSDRAAGFRKLKDESQSRRGRGKRKDIENCIF